MTWDGDVRARCGHYSGRTTKQCKAHPRPSPDITGLGRLLLEGSLDDTLSLKQPMAAGFTPFTKISLPWKSQPTTVPVCSVQCIRLMNTYTPISLYTDYKNRSVNSFSLMCMFAYMQVCVLRGGCQQLITGLFLTFF